MTAPSNLPIFTGTPVIAGVAIATANTEWLYVSGTLGTVLTGTTNGTRVDKIVINATATVAAGTIRFWMYNGATNFDFLEIPVTATTPSVSVANWTKTIVFDKGMVVPNTYVLKASTTQAVTFNVLAFGGDY